MDSGYQRNICQIVHKCHQIVYKIFTKFRKNTNYEQSVSGRRRTRRAAAARTSWCGRAHAALAWGFLTGASTNSIVTAVHASALPWQGTRTPGSRAPRSRNAWDGSWLPTALPRWGAPTLTIRISCAAPGGASDEPDPSAGGGAVLRWFPGKIGEEDPRRAYGGGSKSTVQKPVAGARWNMRLSNSNPVYFRFLVG
jgi:hypothetical protein